MIVRKTRSEESIRVNELFAIAFEQPMEKGPATEEERGLCHWAAFEENAGEMMSTLTVTDFSVGFDGHLCKMGGIGGVATLPQYRRRRGIRGCFQAALPDMYGAGFIPFLPPITGNSDTKAVSASWMFPCGWGG